MHNSSQRYFADRIGLVDIEGDIPHTNKPFCPEKQSGVVEISALIITGLTLQIVNLFHSFVRPEGRVGDFPRRNIHGLSERFLARFESWRTISRRLEEFLASNRVTLVIGVGSDILDLLTQFPAFNDIAYFDLKIPEWRYRQCLAYSATHAAIWCRYSHLDVAMCVDSKHRSFNPYSSYKRKCPHKMWYGVHCSLKDVWYMFCAIRHGVEYEVKRQPAAHNILPSVQEPSDLQVRQDAIFGVLASEPPFFSAAIRLVEAYLRQYSVSTPLQRLSLEAPLLPALFDPNHPQEYIDSTISRIFSLATRDFLLRDYRRNRHPSLSFNLLLRLGQELGSANFGTVTLTRSLIPERRIILITTVQNRILPEGVLSYLLPAAWTAAFELLREVQRSNPSSLIGRVVIENLIRSPQVGRIRRVYRKVRTIFCNTRITFIIFNDKLLASRVASLNKYKCDVLNLPKPRDPAALINTFPHILDSNLFHGVF